MTPVHALFVGLLLTCYVPKNKEMEIVILKDYREKANDLEVYRYFDEYKTAFKVPIDNCKVYKQTVTP